MRALSVVGSPMDLISLTRSCSTRWYKSRRTSGTCRISPRLACTRRYATSAPCSRHRPVPPSPLKLLHYTKSVRLPEALSPKALWRLNRKDSTFGS